jgi:hypothetical protein
MQINKVVRNRMRLVTGWAAIAAASLLALIAGGADSVHATTFNPTLAVAADDPTPGASSDVVANFDLPDGDVNFAAVVSFIPPNWGVVTGDKIPIGMQTGVLDAQSVLGLANGACGTQLPVQFDMLNASIKTNDTVPFTDEDENNTNDFADDDDGNGIFDGIDKYPDFLTRVFKDDDSGEIMQPIRRSAGVTPVAGIPVLLQFLIFEPGTKLPTRGAVELPSDEELGFPSVTVLQAIGDPEAEPEPSIINDFCTPLATINRSFGSEKDEDGNIVPDGVQFFANPQDGTYTWETVAFGQRDADGDSYENSLDTCPLEPNIGNPRITSDGDTDSDGLDQACDPNDSVAGGTNSDEDADGYQNRNDNCPQVPNGEQRTDPEWDNQEDTDLDQIGNACDPDPENGNGDLQSARPTSDVVIGSGSGAGGPPTTDQCPDCWVEGYVVDVGDGGSETDEPTDAPTGDATPGPTDEPDGNGDDDGGGGGATIAIIAGVIAAVVVLGGGAYMVLRRRGS